MPRADAERNRVRLLETAKAAFAEKGSASLDEIARTAGVGGRDSLPPFSHPRHAGRGGLMQRDRAACRSPPGASRRRILRWMALREWLLLFVDYIATKHGMDEVLNSIVGGTSDLYSASTAQVKKAIAKLVDRAVASGDIRLDLNPLDLLRALARGLRTSAWDPMVSGPPNVSSTS